MSLQVTIPKYLQSLIKCSKAKNQIKQIEKKTQTLIKNDPFQGEYLEILSHNLDDLEEAKVNLYAFFNQLKRKLPFTHFLSIPFVHPLFQSNFNQFKKEVLNLDHQLTRIDESLFQNPKKIHLTFGIMTLLTEDEKHFAISLLENCNQIIKNILDEKPIYLNVKGIDAMNKDLSKVHVCYAKIENPEKIQLIADKVVEKFSENGIMSEKLPIKLHITLMNSIFRMRKASKKSIDQDLNSEYLKELKDGEIKSDKKSSSPTSKKRRKIKRESFDIEKLVKNFDQFVFAENLQLEQLHLSIVNKTDKESGYYSALSKVNFPQ